MKAAGKAFGGTINDVAVTIVDAALHRYLDDLGAAPVDRWSRLCPLSLREAGDKEATTKASTMFVPLAKRGATIPQRMEEVMRAIASAKAEMLAMNKDAAILYAIVAFGLSDLAVRTGADAVTRPMANLDPVERAGSAHRPFTWTALGCRRSTRSPRWRRASAST